MRKLPPPNVQYAIVAHIQPKFEELRGVSCKDRHPKGGYKDSGINHQWASFFEGSVAMLDFVYGEKYFNEFNE